MITHIAHTIAAFVLQALGPTVEEANEAAAAQVPDYDLCDVPVLEQPYDCPGRVRWALVSISDRECPNNYCGHRRWVGRHRRDSGHEGGLWRAGHRRGGKGYRRGALHWWCPAHADPEGMSTVGPHGLIYLFNVHRLGVFGNCVPWWIFASPAVSARAATARYLRNCKPGTRDGWCPSERSVGRAFRRRCKRRVLSRSECRKGART